MQYGALHTHQRRNARSRPMLNIYNSLTAKTLLSKSNNLNLQARRRLVQIMSAVEDAVADSVEWNMVRMDLLAHYN
jgi:hypothetical protein